MRKFDKNLLVIVLLIYLVSLVLFDNAYSLNIVYLTNILLLIVFLYVKIKYRTLMKISYNYILILYALFTLFNFLSCSWAINIEFALFKSITLTLVLINSIIIFNILKITSTKAELYLIPFFVGTFINALVLMNIFGYSANFYQDHRFVGLSTNSNLLAIYLLFSIFSSIYFLIKTKYFLIYIYMYLNIAISLYIISFTGSKKGTIFSLLLLFVFFITHFKLNKFIWFKVIKFLIAIYLIFSITNYFVDIDALIKNINILEHRINNVLDAINGSSTDISTKYRIYYTQRALEIFSKNPLLGIGSDNFKVFEGEYSHNNYAEILANTGIIGLILFYSMYITMIKKMLSQKSKTFIIYIFILILMVMDLAYVSYYLKITVFFLLLLFTLIERENNEKQKN